MIYMNAFKKTLGTTTIGASTLLLSSVAFAHTGHSHAQHDTLSGVLHSLTTHPLLFGVVGLTLVAAAYISRN
jgi:hydrogenase/urease accessory protein HupE